MAVGINNACQFWVDEAIDLAPEDTGFLKAHIGQTKAANANDLSGEIRSLAPYSGPVNYGTAKQSAQPFWTVSGLLTRQKFTYLLKSGFVKIGRGVSAGAGVIKSALMDFHGPMGRKGGGF
ncbi:MAG TPA: hypothetical protein VFX97_16855 [Pyrinomonadaceae bacterium]|nr:hypothetical protein [Pyrinomonadaceae bacterium]